MMMDSGAKKRRGLFIVVLCWAYLFAPSLFAAETNHTYIFEKPLIKTLSNGRQLVELPGLRQKDDIVGAPILPVKTLKLFVPANEAVVSIDVTNGTLKTIEGSYQIQHANSSYPLSFQGHMPVDQPEASIYKTNTFYPARVHRIRGKQFLHGVKIVLLDLMPVLYNPTVGQLKYYDNLQVTIRTTQGRRTQEVMPFQHSIARRSNIIDTIENTDDFIDHHPISDGDRFKQALSTVDGLSQEDATREYVVITTRDLASAFQVLTSHRSSSEGGGYTTHIEYIDEIDVSYPGIDLAQKMRNFIREMYKNYGTRYVLLGGDSDGSPEDHVIPTRLVYAKYKDFTDFQIPSDLYFGCLDGSWDGDGDQMWGEANDGDEGGDIDWFSEVYVGRIPADDYGEAFNQISKIIAFETSNHANRTLLVGERLKVNTWGGDRLDWVYSFMDSTPKTELYDRDWGNNEWPISQLLANLNSNRYYWINSSGHSTVVDTMGLGYTDISSLTNKNYMFVYAQGCYSGSIDSVKPDGTHETADCIGESITNRYPDRGAFAFIGNSRLGFHTVGSYVEGASNLAHKEFVEAIFRENYTKLGEANQISKTDLPLGSGLYRWIAFETNLIGCPASDLSIQFSTDLPDCDECGTDDDASHGGGDDGGCFIGSLRW